MEALPSVFRSFRCLTFLRGRGKRKRRTVVYLDIMVVCDKSKIGSEGIRSALDLTIEILSPSNTAIEMAEKLCLYQDAGVREYWVVDPKTTRSLSTVSSLARC